MQTPIPLTRDLVLVGGGHAHALVLRMWGMRPLPGVRLTVINPGPTAPYSGMLPGHVAGHYPLDALEIDLVQLARFAGARLILGAADGIDPEGRIVTVGTRRIGYDVASVDVGIHYALPAIPGFAQHGIGAKPLDSYAAGWRAFLEQAETGNLAPEVAVIGGGVAGVELALAMDHALKTRGLGPNVTVLETGPAVSGLSERAQRKVKAALDAAGITLRTSAQVAGVDAKSVRLAGGEHLPARLVVGAAGASPHRWITDSALPQEDGFIRVGPDLRIEGHDDLFAVGDCAHMTHAPRPKAGVYAVRAAKVLDRNLRAALTGDRMQTYAPQKGFLKLVSLGGKVALADKGGFAPTGPLLWRWKDRIDRRFMARLRDLPQMTPPAPPDDVAAGVDEILAEKPLCGGCGAKIGGDVLTSALAGLPPLSHPDILSGPGDDAAVLRTGGAIQVMTTDHLRAFVEDPVLMTRITALHALGDIWAMGARPQAALAQIILPRMSPALQRRTMDEILTTARDVLDPEGAALVGGHSTMGSELTTGFTLTGLCDRPALTVAGARPGDALVLTRAIGSGTLLAAEMLGRAKGRDIASLWAEMARPQGDAARSLAPVAHAMTDVTGFGLAGHAQAIAQASGVSVVLDLNAVPLYPGALDMSSDGQHSTLMQPNILNAPVFGADPEDARARLLWDPQTAGGMLAAVPKDALSDRLQALHGAGQMAAHVGDVEPGPPSLRLR